MDLITILCPACGETFSIAPPEPSSIPDRLDYDCEICCRPMVLAVDEDENGDLTVEALDPDGTR